MLSSRRDPIQSTFNRLTALGALASLMALAACTPERPQPTKPTLNLVTGCFQSVNATGEPYLLVACLNKAELESLTTHEPGGALAKYVRSAQAEYEEAVAHSPYKVQQVRQPTFNLITGCVAGPGSTWQFLRRERCVPGWPVSPRVERKFSLAMAAYHGQMAADFAAYRPPPSAPPSDYDMPAVVIF
jgi:hypothetical protein